MVYKKSCFRSFFCIRIGYYIATNKADLSSRHNIIYGHHMKNGTMFKDIVKCKDQQYFDEHQDIILYTPDREIHLKALADLSMISQDFVLLKGLESVLGL